MSVHMYLYASFEFEDHASIFDAYTTDPPTLDDMYSHVTTLVLVNSPATVRTRSFVHVCGGKMPALPRGFNANFRRFDLQQISSSVLAM